jgi:hypothetical protein
VINFKNLLPIVADNNYRGHPVALWAFILFVALMTWRSIIHMLFEEMGMHNIANFIILSGDPDPMPLIYRFFSLWGFAQLVFCLICWVIIFRYRALIPLMYLFWFFEWSFRTIGYSFIRESIAVQGVYTVDVTPGATLAPYVSLLLIILLSISLLQKK